MLTCVEQVVADPAFRSDFDHLVDLRQIAEFEASAESIRGRAGRDLGGAYFNSSRIAIVSTSQVAYGSSCMYETLMSDATVTVGTFREIGDALAWLGLPPDWA